MDLLKPTYVDFGMGYDHNMPCCVYTDSEPAVLNTNLGVFGPSWKARQEGWQLIQAKTRFQRWLLKKFFATK